MKYTVFFTDEEGKTQIGDSEFVESNSPEEAVQEFVGNKELKNNRYCLAVWGWGKQKVIPLVEAFKKLEEERQREREQEQQEFNEFLKSLKVKVEQLQNISFLELSAEKRNELYDIISYLSKELEVRALEKEEIEFLKAWHQLKDRELGEELLTKNEMSKPPSQRGKSAFSKTAWAAGFAMQGMATQNALNDIAEHVSDISDGGGGFD